MKQPNPEGIFEVVDSFAIRKRKQFYLIGRLKKGRVEENWFVNIPFNSNTAMTVRVTGIEEVEMASEKEPHMLLIVDCDDEAIDFYMALNVGLVYLPITIEGED